MTAYRPAIRKMLGREELTAEEAAALMNDLMEGMLEQSQVAAILTALAAKGETAAELAGFADVMRRHALNIDAGAPVLDTCGTGGSGLPTVNTSTLCAFIVAATGTKVAKHGNRASSGRCGSMDVLEHLGVNIELTPAMAEQLIQNGPVVFMYARRHHPALGQVTPVRRSLGFRTAFNFLGPMCNPAGATMQMMGVSDPDRAPMLIETLRRLGSDRVMVVWGEDGLDEITLTGKTRAWELRNGIVSERRIDPARFGLDPVPFEEIAGGDVDENAEHFMRILSGDERGPRAAHTALNAAAGLYVAGRVASLEAGYGLAWDILTSGRALEVFETYRAASRTFA